MFAMHSVELTKTPKGKYPFPEHILPKREGEPGEETEEQKNAKGECFTACTIPRGVRDIIWDYLENEDPNEKQKTDLKNDNPNRNKEKDHFENDKSKINTEEDYLKKHDFGRDFKPIKDEKLITNGAAQFYAQFKLFGRGLEYFVNPGELKNAGNKILTANENNIKSVLNLIEKQPFLLHVKTTAVDQRGRKITGKLIEIAAMAGDFNLVKIPCSKDLGLVERLAKAGKLTDREIAEQLKVIYSDTALQVNKERNDKVIKAVTTFKNQILKIPKQKELKTFQANCQPAIKNLEKELEVITSGETILAYLFDPSVICAIGKDFENSVNKFDGWFSVYTATFFVNVFGLLLKQLTVRDAQIAHNGIKNFYDNMTLPPRNLMLKEYYSSELGQSYYLDENGSQQSAEKFKHKAPNSARAMTMFEELSEARNQRIKELKALLPKDKPTQNTSNAEAQKKSFWRSVF